MKINTKHFVTKYAFYYTFFIFAILTFPLYIFYTLLSDMREGEIEFNMQLEAKRVISKIESHNNQVFIYPRSKVYQSGLYNNNFDSIFTLIKSKLPLLNNGYNQINSMRYYVVSFEHNRYFNSRYLVVAKKYDNFKVIKLTLTIFTSIIIIMYFFSIAILKIFSKPFQEINEYLDNFIKNSIHEINTPLSIINVNSDLLKIKQGENKYIQRIKAATKSLSTIYDDMSFFIKKDRLDYKRSTYNLSNFVKERVDYFQSIANLKNITLISDIDSDILYSFNQIEFERLIDNNISNAIKYNKKLGLVNVKLKQRVNTIRLIIYDNGVGIEHPDRILDRFYREDEIKGGFGIGLNIVSDIAQHYSMKIKVISKVDKGTMFIYDLI